jgi:hypothetical protein
MPYLLAHLVSRLAPSKGFVLLVGLRFGRKKGRKKKTIEADQGSQGIISPLREPRVLGSSWLLSILGGACALQLKIKIFGNASALLFETFHKRLYPLSRFSKIPVIKIDI